MTVEQNEPNVFNFEIALTDKALELILINSGSIPKGDKEELKKQVASYKKMTSDKNSGVISSNPNWGIGANINDVLSLGLLMLAKMQKEKIDYSDLSLHPYTIKFPEIKTLEVVHHEGEINEFIPCRMEHVGGWVKEVEATK